MAAGINLVLQSYSHEISFSSCVTIIIIKFQTEDADFNHICILLRTIYTETVFEKIKVLFELYVKSHIWAIQTKLQFSSNFQCWPEQNLASSLRDETWTDVSYYEFGLCTLTKNCMKRYTISSPQSSIATDMAYYEFVLCNLCRRLH